MSREFYKILAYLYFMYKQLTSLTAIFEHSFRQTSVPLTHEAFTLSSLGEYKNLSWVWGADRKIHQMVTRLCGVMPNSDSKGQIFLSIKQPWSPAFDFKVGVAINESCSCMLASVILNLMLHVVTSQWHRLRMPTRYLFFIYPMGRIRICKTRFVSTSENRGKPCLVCKKKFI